MLVNLNEQVSGCVFGVFVCMRELVGPLRLSASCLKIGKTGGLTDKLCMHTIEKRFWCHGEFVVVNTAGDAVLV